MNNFNTLDMTTGTNSKSYTIGKVPSLPITQQVVKIIVWVVWTYCTKYNYGLVTIDHYYEWTQHVVIHRYYNKVINTFVHG